MKRSAWVLALLMVPLAVGEEVRTQSFEDADGDVVVRSQDGTVEQPDPTGNYANVDVVAGGVWAEDDDSVTFYIQLDDLTESSQTVLPFSDPDYYFHFQYREQGYRIFVVTALENPTNGAFGRDGTTFARLERQVDAFRYMPLAEGEVEMDHSEELVKVTVPRGAILDHNQAPLARNATLTGLHVTAKSMGWFGFPIAFGGDPSSATYVGIPEAADRAPDTGDAQYVMTTGSVQQKGRLFAVSADPIRWTNGEATTLSFQSTVTNLGSEDLDVLVDVVGVPGSWELAYSDQITVPAKSALNATFLISIPFTHQHGVTDLFEARFETPDRDHLATSVMGVHWPSVPQPAGHHDRLWLHSIADEVQPPFDAAFSGVHGWFSAKEDLEEDSGDAIEPDFTLSPGAFGAQEGQAHWFLRLEPALRMGLDFRPGDEGTLELATSLPTPVVDPRIEVELLHVRGQQERGGFRTSQTLMTGASEPASGAVSGNVAFQLPLHVVEGIDDIAYDPEANLELRISMYATFLTGTGFVNPATVAPSIEPAASSMQWPLNEYHDPADLTFQTVSELEIRVGATGQERFVNPGRTVVYEFELAYDSPTSTTFEAALTGKNAGWAQIIGDAVFTLGPGETRPLALAISAPDDAPANSQADITLTVTATKNKAIQAGIGTLTTVTTSEDIPDEATRLEELSGELTVTKEAPGLPWLGIAVALALLARRR